MECTSFIYRFVGVADSECSWQILPLYEMCISLLLAGAATMYISYGFHVRKLARMKESNEGSLSDEYRSRLYWMWLLTGSAAALGYLCAVWGMLGTVFHWDSGARSFIILHAVGAVFEVTYVVVFVEMLMLFDKLAQRTWLRMTLSCDIPEMHQRLLNAGFLPVVETLSNNNSDSSFGDTFASDSGESNDSLQASRGIYEEEKCTCE